MHKKNLLDGNTLETTIKFIVRLVLVVIATFYLLTYCDDSINNSKLKVNDDHIRIMTGRFGPEGTDYHNSKSEFARLSFTLDADFTSLFNWNTKQIFVTVVAEYETNSYGRNLIVIWDKIITRREDAYLLLHDVSNKYALVDISNKWNSEKISLSLFWDKMPYIGILQSGRSSNNSSYFIIPSPAKTP